MGKDVCIIAYIGRYDQISCGNPVRPLSPRSSLFFSRKSKVQFSLRHFLFAFPKLLFKDLLSHSHIRTFMAESLEGLAYYRLFSHALAIRSLRYMIVPKERNYSAPLISEALHGGRL